MRTTVVQMSPGHDKAANLAQAERLCEAAIAEDRPDIIALPEIWTCLGGTREDKFASAEVLPKPGSNEPAGEAYGFLQNLARRHHIHVHGGSIGERAGEKLANTTVVFDPRGAEIARYRKIHLFDITAPDGKEYKESATYARGEEIVTYEANGTRVGCAICYDVRFPELFLKLRQAGAELIFLPAAFTLQTGKDHWETLIRARAIETQCWFAAPACCGPHTEGSGGVRYSYGHSLIADPWGHTVAKASDGIGFTTARIENEVTLRVRADMPVLEHRVLA
ncbi:MAG: carbon-nitrogen hydrolase family protein [Acetobacteraceae bacterium]|nr:carbon-nitrogen hydrolase family protein [Acetobacteraceae bacterium]